jgi:hypothetical protein
LPDGGDAEEAELSARESGSASRSTPLLSSEYDSLIERVRETVDGAIPRNATVLVVSRGDEELLRIGPRRALHFPQDEFGRYAGYHPEDSDGAISALEDMRIRGAEYLLLPSSAFWWLDYYEGLRDHLQEKCRSVEATDDCMVFELATADVQSAWSDADTSEVSAATSSPLLAGALEELLRALLPADARIAVVGGRAGDLPSFGSITAVDPPSDSGDLTALLDQAGATGAEFVVIPATAQERVTGDEADGWTLVTRQKHLGDVYERSAAGGRRPAEDTANCELRTANPSFLQRLLRLFR